MKYATVGAVDRAPDPFAPTYVSPNPIDPAAPLPSATPLPPGSAPRVTTVNTGAWSLEAFGQYVGTGADLLQKSGVTLPGPVAGFDFGAAFAKIAAASATGAAVGGPWGAAIGAVIAIVTNLGGLWDQLQNPNWYAVGPGVHDWATRYAESAFISEAQAKGTNRWQTVAEIARHQLVWWLGKYGAVVTGQQGRFYSGIDDNLYVAAAGGADEVRKIYAGAGVDWDGTRAARAAANDYRANANVVMYKLEIVPRGADPVNTATGLSPTPVPTGTGSEYAGASAGTGAALLLGGVVLLGLASKR